MHRPLPMHRSRSTTGFMADAPDRTAPHVRRSPWELSDRDVLDLLESADPVGPALTPEPAVLVAPAGGVGAEHRCVDVHRSGSQPSGDADGGGDIGAVHLA